VETLLRLGRGDLIGRDAGGDLRAPRPRDAGGGSGGPRTSAGGGRAVLLTVDHLGLTARVGRYEPGPRERVIFALGQSDREPAQPAFRADRKRSRGRVALCPYDMAASTTRPCGFMNGLRKRQMAAIARWLFHDRLPLLVRGGVYALPLRNGLSRLHALVRK